MTYEEFTRYLKTIGAFYPEKNTKIQVYVDEEKVVEFEITNSGVESAKFWKERPW